jgi:hypothetical protein
MSVRAVNVEPVAARSGASAQWPAMVRSAPVPVLQALLIGGCLFLFLQGWHRDISVPLAFSSDSLWYLMQSKGTIDNGWWWWNPRVGAPLGLDVIAYPSNSTVDQAILWLVSRVVTNAMAAVNLTWALLVVLSGLSATWCLRRLAVSPVNAVVAGTLFALSPYAIYRNIDHFSLVIYLVPFACAPALWLAAGQPHQTWGRTACAIVFAGCALLGLNYVYYAFFACFCIVAGALIGYLVRRERRVLVSGALCVMIISGTTLINLAPSFYSWSQNGRPMLLRDKVPAEAETFGLKIRQLVSPVYPHRFPPFHNWVEREAAARFPNENENWTSRLGLVGTLGFLGLLALLFVPDSALTRSWAIVRAASKLTLAALLLATVGGFGSLFNLFVSPDIRAYNRISPFLAFFSLLAAATAIDAVFKSPRSRVAAALTMLLVGVSDQGEAARRLNVQHGGIAAEISGLDAFIGTLQSALPTGAMVFQLPFRNYMSESDFGRMKAYDHFKPYLVSETLRFSYPALSNEQVRWQLAAAHLDVPKLASQLSSQGFSAVLIDRYGYEDAGAAMLSALLRITADKRVIASTDRFVVVDITSVPDDTARTKDPAPRSVALTLSLAPCGGPVTNVVKVEDQVEQIGGSHSPFPATGARILSAGESRVSGWAIDHPNRAPADGVDVVIDKMLFPSTYGTHRSDVAEYFRRTDYRDTGFTATIPANALAAGEHWLSLRVVSSNGGCYYQSPSVRVTVE